MYTFEILTRREEMTIQDVNKLDEKLKEQLKEVWRICPYVGYCQFPRSVCIKCVRVLVVEAPKANVTYNEFIPYMEPEEKK